MRRIMHRTRRVGSRKCPSLGVRHVLRHPPRSGPGPSNTEGGEGEAGKSSEMGGSTRVTFYILRPLYRLHSTNHLSLTSSPHRALGAFLFIQKRAGLFSPARSYKPTSVVGVDTIFYFIQNFTSVRCVRAVSACSVATSAWPALPCSMASFRCVIASFKCEFLPPLSA